MDDFELSRPAAEDPRPAPEYARDAEREFGRRPPEFSAGTAPEPEPERKRRRRARKLLCAAAGAALAVFLCAHTGALPLPAPPAETAAPAASEPPAPTAGPAVTEMPVETEPLPVYETYPLSDGTILVTVFNNTFDLAGIDWANYTPGEELRVLLRETVPEAEFKDVALPEAVVDADDEYWNYDFAGFVLHFNGQFDPGYAPGSETEPFVRLLGDTLTRADVETVPPGVDGIRYVNIHAMWRSRLDPDVDPVKLLLLLDDGMGNVTKRDGDTPYASEGYTYLAAYPVPEREGYRFLGWYDAEGERVESVSYFDYFENAHLVVQEDGSSYMDADWNHPRPVTLTARWEKLK